MNSVVSPNVRFAEVPRLDPTIVAALEPYWWPLQRAGEGLVELACRSGLQKNVQQQLLETPASFEQGSTQDFSDWILWATARIGLDAESVDTTVPDVDTLLRDGGPALVPYAGASGAGFFVLLSARRGQLCLLGPDLVEYRCTQHDLRTALCWSFEAPLIPEIQNLLESSHVDAKRLVDVRAAMLRERLARERINPIWIVRAPTSASFIQQLLHAKVPQKIGKMLCIFALIYALEIVGWAWIGDAALSGRLDFGWLTAWVLVVASMIPLRLMGNWFESTFALETSRVLKSRLLAGALNMEVEAVRTQGVGHLLGRVMEAQALESLTLNGGLSVVVAIMELCFAGWIFLQGAAGLTHLLLMLLWLSITGLLTWRYYGWLRQWTLQRLDMTHGLIERMVGHRTRLAQERAGRRDASEDQMLQSYLHTSKAMDGAGVAALAGLPAGWMVLGLIGLIPNFVAGTATSTTQMAISLGGILIAQRAFTSISGGLSALARASIAWEQVKNLFNAGSRSDSARPFLTRDQLRGADTATQLIEVHGVSFKYQTSSPSILREINLDIHRGEKILLQGPSGGGKSTLASLLIGLRLPDSGLMLMNGLDHHTLGDSWHRLATAAPQFHENHILSGTLAFNLLMGREWPASTADIAEAESLCIELGLGDLLQRMPAGMQQHIGETGWQLSHGERSRIFLARALLQNAQLTIMDESFAALDPETLEKCLRCCMERAETLIVVAHP